MLVLQNSLTILSEKGEAVVEADAFACLCLCVTDWLVDDPDVSSILFLRSRVPTNIPTFLIFLSLVLPSRLLVSLHLGFSWSKTFTLFTNSAISAPKTINQPQKAHLSVLHLSLGLELPHFLQSTATNLISWPRPNLARRTLIPTPSKAPIKLFDV